MKAFLFCLVFISTFGTKAQYMITSASNPVAGDIEGYVDIYPTGLSAPASGTNKIWNYSNITFINISSASSSTYVPISSVPNYSLFNGATIGQCYGPYNYDVYKINTSTRDYLGIAATSATNCLVLSNSMTLLKLPFTYGSSYFDTFDYNIAGDILTGSITIVGTGTGTLILPGFTINNVLKVSLTYNQIDIYPTSTFTTNGLQEIFYSSISKFPLFTINTSTIIQSSTSSVDISAKVNNVVALGVGIKESSIDDNFSIFPNPVNTKAISVSFNNKGESTVNLILLNTLGQIVIENSFDNLQTGENKVTLDLKTIPAGIYYLQIKTNDQESTKKLIIE